MSAVLQAIAIVTSILSGQTSDSRDTCAAIVPKELATAVERRFPRHRLPVVQDNHSVDVEYEKQQGGDGCLSADRGDYNGDRITDVALLLSPREKSDGNSVLLVVALARANSWELGVLRDWGTRAFGRLYVATVPPGHYRRTPALADPPTQPGEVEEIEGAFDGIASGVLESSEIVFFLDAGCWKHVWVGD
jgi:hypothetical protein